MPARKIRYAVVGLGHIAQVAMLPAFAHATKNSKLAALVSDNPRKLRLLGRKYGVTNLYSYAEYDSCLRSGEIDAVYIALPNSMHGDFAVRAARQGIHVLCEKPMAVTERECRAMIRAAVANRVRLMIAYRLHFEAANLGAIEIIRSGKIGEPRIFHSLFTLNVKPGNLRLRKELGGGTLYDIGIYCINAARYLFRSEPLEVIATSASSRDARFAAVEEMVSATLRFPGERLATFTCGFGTEANSAIDIAGTKGALRLDPAYEYASELEQRLTISGKVSRKSFSRRDQFAPELLYFSECILRGKDPEPSGLEGLADVRIIEALYRSARTGKPARIPQVQKGSRPSLRQQIRRPPVTKPREVS